MKAACSRGARSSAAAKQAAWTNPSKLLLASQSLSSRCTSVPARPRGNALQAARTESSADARAPQASFLADLRASAYPGERLYSINSWAFLGVTLGMAVTSLAAFNALVAAILSGAVAQGYQGDPAALGILDLRNGYTPDQVSFLLAAWSPQGRQLYLLIEAIDVTLYHYGYRGVGVVLFNRLGSYLAARLPMPASGWVRYISLGPVIVAASDFFEDAAQVAVVTTYGADPAVAGLPWWQSLVGVASTLNVSKWALCNTASLAGAVLALAAAGLAVKERLGGAADSTRSEKVE